jgi:3-mercaptopyruvate sulfurtransferase SseA
MNMRINRGWAGMTVLVLALGLQGCGGDEDTTSTASQIVVNTPASIAQVSADNYDDNVNGLITPATLKRWKDDWPTERAKLGLTGKLIILQVTAGPAGAEYIKPDGVNVFTYCQDAILCSVQAGSWTQTRTNGVIESVSMVPDGAQMDANLKKYNIDPRNDMIVAAMGAGSNPNAMAQGRIWYALRYWGVDKKNLAILNGANAWTPSGGVLTYPAGFTAADFQAAPTTAPNNGTVSVKSLPVDNTQLQATLDDMLKILPSGDTNVKTDGVFIWDARSLGQYSAGQMVEFGEDTDSDTASNQACATAYCAPVNPNNYMWTFQNGGSRQGHPHGTLQLQYTYMLDSTKGFAYRPKAELAAYLTGATTISGIGFVGADYSTVGAGNAYQEGDTIYTYCETTFRAMITGVASAVILGKPTRFYDGAMVEWNALSNILDKNGDYLLPADSPWRTDLKSFYRPATSYTLVNPRIITDPYAASANALVNADKAYKTGESAASGSSGGAPTNPCGG